MVIKELNQRLIQSANNSSFSGNRGNNSEAEYKGYAQKIIDLPVSDENRFYHLHRALRRLDLGGAGH